MNNKELYKLIIKYLDDDILDAEKDLLVMYLENENNRKEFEKFLSVNYLINKGSLNFDYKNPLKKALGKIEKEKKEKKAVIKLWPVLRYAAIIVLFVSLGLYLTKDKLINKPELVLENDIKIGTNKAILTLEDGVKVSLEKGKTYSNSDLKSNGEQIVYESKAKSDEVVKSKLEIAFNYLTIPRGGEFFIELADKTKVWLNSESKIKYPVEFLEGETREVELLYGEAYFEVSPSSMHNGAKFKVLTQGQEVEVLGTKFNIKAYKDENAIYTTLVEGKVAIGVNNTKEILQPNEQATFSYKTESIKITAVDVFDEISWKNGMFSFNDMPLKKIMKVLSRWYDIDVVFKNKEIESVNFNGVLRKNQTIIDILSTINNTNPIAYDITDKTVIFR